MLWGIIGIIATILVAWFVYYIQQQRRSLVIETEIKESDSDSDRYYLTVHALIKNRSTHSVQIESGFIRAGKVRVGFDLKSQLLPGAERFSFWRSGHWIAKSLEQNGIKGQTQIRIGIIDVKGNLYESDLLKADLEKWQRDNSHLQIFL